MTAQNDYRRVLKAYPSIYQPRHVEHIGSAGGFSGAMFWRWQTELGELCLKRWPAEHPSAERLEFIHSVLRHVVKQGFGCVPLPLDTTSGNSYVAWGGHLWELTPWLPGIADDGQSPSEARLCAAMEMLARFHRTVASFQSSRPTLAKSPTIVQRLEKLHSLAAGGLTAVAAAVDRRPDHVLAPPAGKIMAHFPGTAPEVERLLIAGMKHEVELHPCIRDVRQEHVLFSGSVVTGLVDFGAMRMDNVSADVARLLGSMAGDDVAQRQKALDAFSVVYPLSEVELGLVTACDRAAVLLSGLLWLEWIFVEKRRFEKQNEVKRRLDMILSRLACVGKNSHGSETT